MGVIDGGILFVAKIKGSLVESDKCTKSFHRMANLYRRNNAIDMLHFDGCVILSPTEIQDLIVNYYENILFESASWWPRPAGLDFESLDPLGASWLERLLRWSVGWSKIKLLDRMIFLWHFF